MNYYILMVAWIISTGVNIFLLWFCNKQNADRRLQQELIRAYRNRLQESADEDITKIAKKIANSMNQRGAFQPNSEEEWSEIIEESDASN